MQPKLITSYQKSKNVKNAKKNDPKQGGMAKNNINLSSKTKCQSKILKIEASPPQTEATITEGSTETKKITKFKDLYKFTYKVWSSNFSHADFFQFLAGFLWKSQPKTFKYDSHIRT